jgi:SsrA-binding protein
MAAKPDPRFKLVADNRKARFNYAIGEVFEAGIVLTGSEVKSMRAGKTSIAESYATSRDGELWLLNSNISEYKQAGRFNHEPKRPRKLCCTAPDQQADRRGRARGHDGRAAENLFQ